MPGLRAAGEERVEEAQLQEIRNSKAGEVCLGGRQ